MSKNAAAYAEQLFAIARQANYLEKSRDELTAILSALEEQPKFLELLMTPTMEKEAKKELIKSTFFEETSRIVSDFLIVLLEEDGLELLSEIGKNYQNLVAKYLEDYFGILEGTVYSAVPLKESQLAQLIHIFSKKTGKKIRLNSEIDESLIGGYKVSVANMVYDSTLKLQLKQLKENLMHVELE